MAIIVLQHSASEGPGRLGQKLRDHGKRVDIRKLWLPKSAQNPHLPTDLDNVEGVISLGGSMSVNDSGLGWLRAELEFLKLANDRKLPVVGVCLGAQLIAKALGGTVGAMDVGAEGRSAEWGMGQVKQNPVANTETVLAGISWTSWQFHAHGEEIKQLPAGATALQFSDRCKVQSFKVGLRTFGFQYHFECDLAMIQDFLLSKDPQIARAGIVEPRRAIQDATEKYEPYARAGDRLCANLSEYVFPVSRRIVA